MPNLPPSWKREIQEAIEESAASERNQRKTQQNEASAEISAAINAPRDAQTAQTSSEDTNEKKNQGINKATLILVALTVLFTGLSWCAFREQLEATRDETVLTHPPRLQVRLITIDGDAPSSFQPGQKEKIKGSGWLFNAGSSVGYEDADGFLCVWYWAIPPLPMKYLYQERPQTSDTKGRCENLQKYNFLTNTVGGSPAILRQGDLAEFSFIATVPNTYTPAMNFYILGRAIYKDRLGTRYPTGFARKYDLTKRYFVNATDNRDYQESN